MTDDLVKLRQLHALIRECLNIEAGWKKRREALEEEYRALSLQMGKRAAEERNASDDPPHHPIRPDRAASGGVGGACDQPAGDGREL